MTLEQFDVGFMRDLFPDSEVALWRSLTAAWASYHEKYLDTQGFLSSRRRNCLPP
jgi:hypothetical protein